MVIEINMLVSSVLALSLLKPILRVQLVTLDHSFLGGRRTYFDLIKPLFDTDPANPVPDYFFYDINGKAVFYLTDDDKLTFAGFASNDNLQFSNNGVDLGLDIGNRAGSMKFDKIWEDDAFSSSILSYSKYFNNFVVDNSGYEALIDNYISDLSFKSNIEFYLSESVTLKTGLELNYYTFSYLQDFTGSTDSTAEGSNSGSTNFDVNDLNSSLFIQSNIQFTDFWSLQVGARATHYQLAFRDENNFFKQIRIDPRLASRFQVSDEFAVKLAWGIYHQNLKLATQPDFSFFDTWLVTDETLELGKATHYILSTETKLDDLFDINFDIYYKQMENVNELNRYATKIEKGEDVLHEGFAESFGFELFLQKSYGEFTGWIGYAFGVINAKYDSLNSNKWFNPKYDRRHDFKAVAFYDFNDSWDFGASFVFQSGQHYTGMTSWARAGAPGTTFGRGKTFPSQLYGLDLPPSHYLNVNANYSFHLFGYESKLFIDIFNIYSNRDIWFRLYQTNDSEIPEITDFKLLPILPTISFEIKF